MSWDNTWALVLRTSLGYDHIIDTCLSEDRAKNLASEYQDQLDDGELLVVNLDKNGGNKMRYNCGLLYMVLLFLLTVSGDLKADQVLAHCLK